MPSRDKKCIHSQPRILGISVPGLVFGRHTSAANPPGLGAWLSDPRDAFRGSAAIRGASAERPELPRPGPGGHHRSDSAPERGGTRIDQVRKGEGGREREREGDRQFQDAASAATSALATCHVKKFTGQRTQNRRASRADHGVRRPRPRSSRANLSPPRPLGDRGTPRASFSGAGRETTNPSPVPGWAFWRGFFDGATTESAGGRAPTTNIYAGSSA